MARWCLNTVKFEADGAVLEVINGLFTDMSKKQSALRKGQLPPFYSADTGHFFDIELVSSLILYQTRDLPNIPVVISIAKEFKSDFLYLYQDTEVRLLGLSVYRRGVLIDIRLAPGDFDLYKYDVVSGDYIFEGERYSDDVTILDILLKRRVEGLYTFHN